MLLGSVVYDHPFLKEFKFVVVCTALKRRHVTEMLSVRLAVPTVLSRRRPPEDTKFIHS